MQTTATQNRFRPTCLLGLGRLAFQKAELNEKTPTTDDSELHLPSVCAPADRLSFCGVDGRRLQCCQTATDSHSIALLHFQSRRLPPAPRRGRPHRIYIPCRCDPSRHISITRPPVEIITVAHGNSSSVVKLHKRHSARRGHLQKPRRKRRRRAKR